jgi:hypothetical protein
MNWGDWCAGWLQATPHFFPPHLHVQTSLIFTSTGPNSPTWWELKVSPFIQASLADNKGIPTAVNSCNGLPASRPVHKIILITMKMMRMMRKMGLLMAIH